LPHFAHYMVKADGRLREKERMAMKTNQYRHGMAVPSAVSHPFHLRLSE